MPLSQFINKVTSFGRHQSRVAQQKYRNRQTMGSQTTPFFDPEIQWLFDVSEQWVAETWTEYKATPAAWLYLSGLQSPNAKTDGFAKSLDVAEGFAVWSLVKSMRPRIIAELGVQYGISSRVWKEALNRYVPDHDLLLFDLEDNRRFIGDSESTFFEGDAYETLPDVLASMEVDILHNDAHPYSLIDWSVRQGLEKQIKIFTFHDISARPPRNTFKRNGIGLNRKEKLENDVNWATFGHWERHVMAEQFDERLLDEPSAENERFKVFQFESLFGFGVALNKSALAVK